MFLHVLPVGRLHDVDPTVDDGSLDGLAGLDGELTDGDAVGGDDAHVGGIRQGRADHDAVAFGTRFEGSRCLRCLRLEVLVMLREDDAAGLARAVYLLDEVWTEGTDSHRLVGGNDVEAVAIAIQRIGVSGVGREGLVQVVRQEGVVRRGVDARCLFVAHGDGGIGLRGEGDGLPRQTRSTARRGSL